MSWRPLTWKIAEGTASRRHYTAFGAKHVAGLTVGLASFLGGTFGLGDQAAPEGTPRADSQFNMRKAVDPNTELDEKTKAMGNVVRADVEGLVETVKDRVTHPEQIPVHIAKSAVKAAGSAALAMAAGQAAGWTVLAGAATTTPMRRRRRDPNLPAIGTAARKTTVEIAADALHLDPSTTDKALKAGGKDCNLFAAGGAAALEEGNRLVASGLQAAENAFSPPLPTSAAQKSNSSRQR